MMLPLDAYHKVSVHHNVAADICILSHIARLLVFGLRRPKPGVTVTLVVILDQTCVMVML